MEIAQQRDYGFRFFLSFPNLFSCRLFKAAGSPISFVAVSHNNSNCFNLQGSLFPLVIIICMIMKQTGIQPNHPIFLKWFFYYEKVGECHFNGVYIQHKIHALCETSWHFRMYIQCLVASTNAKLVVWQLWHFPNFQKKHVSHCVKENCWCKARPQEEQWAGRWFWHSGLSLNCSLSQKYLPPI